MPAPSARAARATAPSASRWAISSTPTGASMTGVASRRPNSSIDLSRTATPRTMPGTIRQTSHPPRLPRTAAAQQGGHDPPAAPAGAIGAHRRLAARPAGDVRERLRAHRLACAVLERLGVDRDLGSPAGNALEVDRGLALDAEGHRSGLGDR